MLKRLFLLSLVLCLTSCYSDPTLYTYNGQRVAWASFESPPFLDKVVPKNSVKVVQDGKGLVFAILRDDKDNIKIYPVTDTP
jgi:hypothetical protein